MKKLYIIPIFVIVPLYAADHEGSPPGNHAWLRISHNDSSVVAMSSSRSPLSSPSSSQSSDSDSDELADAHDGRGQSRYDRARLYQALDLHRFEVIREGSETLGGLFDDFLQASWRLRQDMNQLQKQVTFLSDELSECKKECKELSALRAASKQEREWLEKRIALCEALLSGSNEQENNEGNVLSHLD